MRAIAEIVTTVWPNEDRTRESLTAELQGKWRDDAGPDETAPRSFVIRDEDRIIAHASYEPRTIQTTRGQLTILALARVCTLEERRGQGLGAEVVRAAFRAVDDGVFSFALFQTTTDVRPFYERLGACVVTNRIVDGTSDQPDACPFWDSVILRYADGTDWPDGKIDLQGPAY